MKWELKLKLSEENTGKNTHGDDFLDKSRARKEQSRYVGHGAEKCVCAEGHRQQSDRVGQERGKTCPDHVRGKRSTPRIKNSITQPPKNRQLIKKWARTLTFFHRRHTGGQWAYGNIRGMSPGTCRPETQQGATSHPLGCLLSKKQKISIGLGVGTLACSHCLWEHWNGAAPVESGMAAPQKMTWNYHMV